MNHYNDVAYINDIARNYAALMAFANHLGFSEISDDLQKMAPEWLAGQKPRDAVFSDEDYREALACWDGEEEMVRFSSNIVEKELKQAKQAFIFVTPAETRVSVTNRSDGLHDEASIWDACLNARR